MLGYTVKRFEDVVLKKLIVTKTSVNKSQNVNYDCLNLKINHVEYTNYLL